MEAKSASAVRRWSWDCNITHTDTETWPSEKWWDDVIASAVMALWSVSVPLNQAASMW